MDILWVATGGAMGASSRFLIGSLLARWTGTALPWPTLAINVSGCLALGLLDAWLTTRPTGTGGGLRSFLGAGFLGGFTTFSAFGLETTRLLQRQAMTEAIAYVVLSVMVGLAAVPVGQALGRRLSGTLPPFGSASTPSVTPQAEHPPQ